MVEALKDFPTDLGTILVKMGAITWEQLHRATEKKHQADMKLGDVLIAEGLLDQETLNEALDLQNNLRNSDGVPLQALERLYNHAVENYQRHQSRLSNMLDEAHKR